jgi:hypothetical protein
MVCLSFLHYTSLCIFRDKNLGELLMLCFVLWVLCCSFLSIKSYVCTWVDLLFVNTQNQTTSWLVQSWNTFGAKTSHEQTQIHMIHHGLKLWEATTFPLIGYSMPGHMTNTQLSFVPRLPSGSFEIPTTGSLATLGPIILRVNLWLRWSLKKNCIPHWDFQ